MKKKTNNSPAHDWLDECVTIDILCTDIVVDALRAMRDKDQPEWARLTLCDCAAKGRFDLLESAAKIIRHEPKELTMHVARFVAKSLRRNDKDPAKGDVLTVLKEFTPGLVRHIPKNKGEIAKWWKRAELEHLPKTSGIAGEVPDPLKYALKSIKSARLEKG
jgi:hypothetical protein